MKMKTKILFVCLFAIGLNGNAQEGTAKKNTKIVLNNGGGYDGKTPLIFVNGKTFTDREMEALNPDSILSINILKDATAVLKYGEEGKNGVILITTKGNNSIADVLVIDENMDIEKWPLYILNGVKLSKSEVMAIKPDEIESITVLKDAKSIANYGTAAQNGVVLIVTKKR
jgi:bla regulator protein BlaR1